MASYLILNGIDGKPMAIQCIKCGMISYNPNDIYQRYCGKCHEFHEHLMLKYGKNLEGLK